MNIKTWWQRTTKRPTWPGSEAIFHIMDEYFVEKYNREARLINRAQILAAIKYREQHQKIMLVASEAPKGAAFTAPIILNALEIECLKAMLKVTPNE